jgi:protoporphyrinogen IX oxidase
VSVSPARLALVAGAIVAATGFVLYAPMAWYDWIKALHVIAIIAWMAAMLYLPRLFVYHAEAGPGSPQSETFKIMERRLLKAIMNPAMIAAWILGLWLAWRGFGFSGGWLHAKIAAVLVLSGLHGYFAGAVRRFAADEETRSSRHWRFMNEAPTLLMVVIVVLVIVKPF